MAQPKWPLSEDKRLELRDLLHEQKEAARDLEKIWDALPSDEIDDWRENNEDEMPVLVAPIRRLLAVNRRLNSFAKRLTDKVVDEEKGFAVAPLVVPNYELWDVTWTVPDAFDEDEDVFEVDPESGMSPEDLVQDARAHRVRDATYHVAAANLHHIAQTGYPALNGRQRKAWERMRDQLAIAHQFAEGMLG